MALHTRPSRPSRPSPRVRRRPRILAGLAGAAALLAAAAGCVQDGALSAAGDAVSAGIPGVGVPVPLPPTGTATIGGLTPETRRAYRAAAAAMRAAGIRITLSSGYRTPAEQQQLYEQAVAKYGSPEAARIWVLPPDESQHVRGVAVDVAPREAAQWLDEHGARFGLCRTMDWEWWHFEYDAGWQRAGDCPPPRRRP